MKPRYQKIVSLSEAEYKVLESLNNKGFKTIDIFRAGMAAYLKQDKS